MLIKLSSSNNDFSYVINKNPSSPPRVSELRRGYLFSWFTENGEYWSRFIDSADEISFPDYYGQKFEYLSSSKYVHPEIPLSIIETLFRKLDSEKDIVSDNKIEILHLRIKNRTLSIAQKYSERVNVEFTPLKMWDKYYRVTLTNKGTLQDLLDFTQLLCLLVCLDNREYLNLPNDRYIKFFKMVGRFDCPYFIRYLLKTNIVKNNPKRFEEVKEFLNESNSHKYEITPYNNQHARLEFVRPYLQDKYVLDIGCGEGNYLSKFAALNKSYIGIEPNEDRVEKCKKKILKKKLDNVDVYSSIDDFQHFKPHHFKDQNIDKHTVLAVEVLEHVEDPAEFLKEITTEINFDKIIITTPNKDFNHLYKLGEEMRHEEHLREFTKDELTSILDELKVDYTVYNVGDVVDGISPTFGVVIAKED